MGLKLAAFGRGLVQMVLSTEGSGARRLEREPDPSILQGWVTETRDVVFIRHGESTWNEIFNQGKGPGRFLWMPVRLALGIVREVMAFLSPESIFLDSPLSSKGIQQAVEIHDALRCSVEHAELVEVVNRTNSVVCSSNLIRAVETVTIALADRLAETGEQIFIRSELQEISRNLDAVALAPPQSCPLLPALAKAQSGAKLDFRNLYNADGNKGNKAVLGHPRHRIARFAAFCFGDDKVQGLECLRKAKSTVIVAGHSLWFKTFFRMYMDKNARHDAKNRKISNAGIVTFTLERGNVGGRMLYRIRPDTIRILRGHFQ